MKRKECQHGKFIKLVGDKFDKGEANISKFTVLLFEYFSMNQPDQAEYKAIKEKWGYLIDFNLSNFRGTL